MENNKFDVVIIGGGVSGLLSAIMIARYTNARVGLFEQGASYPKRKQLSLIDNSVHLKGLGGAGTLDGGKLCSFPASGSLWEKTGQALCNWESFVNHLPFDFLVRKALLDGKRKYFNLISNAGNLYQKEYNSILLMAGEMHEFINGLIEESKSNHVEVYDYATLEEIEKQDDEFSLTMKIGESRKIVAKKVVLATGRQSAGRIPELLRCVPVKIAEQSPDLGIRIEFPKNHSESFSIDGKDTKIKMDIQDFRLRTFCVCAGGIVSSISLNSMKYFDGQFESTITNKTNLGIMSRSAKLKGISVAADYCKAFQDNDGMMNLEDFIKRGDRLLKKKYQGQFGPLIESVNFFTRQLLKKGHLNSDIRDCSVHLPAIDRYNPLVQTDQNFETGCSDLFVIGDAAGVSRGYIQSLWSGWCCSHEIIAQINNRTKYECIADMEKIITYA